MRQLSLGVLLFFIMVALVVGTIGLASESTAVKWGTPAIGIALIAIGLGLSSWVRGLQTDRQLNTILSHIEQLRRERSHSTLGETLASITDYIIERGERSKR